jgi:hypothetical protein
MVKHKNRSLLCRISQIKLIFQNTLEAEKKENDKRAACSNDTHLQSVLGEEADAIK